jgi:hypothetical protein
MLPTTRRKRWIGVGDESDMRTRLVSETISIPGRDYHYPGEPNRSRVRFRPGLQSSGYKRQGFEVQGSFRQTSTSSGFRIDFFPCKISFHLSSSKVNCVCREVELAPAMEIAMMAINPVLQKLGDLLAGEFTFKNRVRKGIECLPAR